MAKWPTCNQETLELPGGFKEGDLVVGPFGSVRKTGVQWSLGEYVDISCGPGLGIVKQSAGPYTNYINFVPVKVIEGARSSGGYLPESLTKVETKTGAR